jgi:hypothetical protein
MVSQSELEPIKTPTFIAADGVWAVFAFIDGLIGLETRKFPFGLSLSKSSQPIRQAQGERVQRYFSDNVILRF